MRRFLIGVAAVAVAMLAAACDASGPSAASGSSAAPTTTAPSASDSPTTTGPTTTGAQPDDRCDEDGTWGTAEKSAEPSTADAFYLVRVGKHDCFDRIVMDVNGPADVGYLIKYVPVVSADGSGNPFPVAGKAALQVVLHAPAQGSDEAGHQPGKILGTAGDRLYPASRFSGWRSLREIRFAGSFEGYSTVAVGVRAKLPFRVFTQLDETDQVRRLIIDISHG